LEIVKKRVYNEKGSKRVSAQYGLYQSLLVILKLIAPIMPFITEEIYQQYYKKFEGGKSIHLSEWPKVKDLKQKQLDEVHIFATMAEIISNTRKWKTKAKKSMRAEIRLIILRQNYDKLKPLLQDLKDVVNAKEIKTGKQFRVEFI